MEPLRAEVSASDDGEDLVDGAVWGQRAVEDGKLALQALRDVVAAAARVDHRRHELDVDDVGELARLLEAVEALHLHRLTRYLVGDLPDSQTTQVATTLRHILRENLTTTL